MILNYLLSSVGTLYFNWLWIIPLLWILAKYVKNYDDNINNINYSMNSRKLGADTALSILSGINPEYVYWDGKVGSHSGIYIQILILNGAVVCPVVLVQSKNPIEVNMIEHEYSRLKEHYSYHTNNMLNIMYISSVEKDLDFSNNYMMIFKNFSIGYPIYPILDKLFRFAKYFRGNRPISICISNDSPYLTEINQMIQNGFINSNMLKFPFIHKKKHEIRQIALNKHLLMLSA